MLLVDDEHGEKEAVDDMLMLLLAVLDGVLGSMRSKSMRCFLTRGLC